MRRIWVDRTIEAPADVVWRLLTTTQYWPAWGPSVRNAMLDGDEFGPGATGTVETVAGLTVRFEITTVVEGRHWSWNVAGIGATEHRVEPLDATRCRAGFGVPWVAAPYTAVCTIALRRLDALAIEIAGAAREG